MEFGDLVTISPLIAAVLTAAAVLIVDLAWPGRDGPAIGTALVGLAITAFVTIQVGVNQTGKYFGNTQRSVISGTVWNDANVNAIIDSGEAGLSGWRVWIDADRDGVLDSGEKSVLTNSLGNWSFSDVVAGTYQIRVVQQAGWARTTPPVGYYTVTIASGEAATNRRFGQRRL